MINKNHGYTLEYQPDPKKILSAMREKQKELADELFNGAMPEHIRHVFEVAWREACLSCLDQISDTALIVKLEKIEWQEPARSYLKRVYKEIMMDNALSPFVNYES